MLTSQNSKQPPNQLTVTLVLSKSQCVHQFESNLCSTNEINFGHLIKVDKLQAGHFSHSAHLEISQTEKLLLTHEYGTKVISPSKEWGGAESRSSTDTLAVIMCPASKNQALHRSASLTCYSSGVV